MLCLFPWAKVQKAGMDGVLLSGLLLYQQPSVEG